MDNEIRPQVISITENDEPIQEENNQEGEGFKITGLDDIRFNWRLICLINHLEAFIISFIYW
jgi:hypothetical protein